MLIKILLLIFLVFIIIVAFFDLIDTIPFLRKHFNNIYYQLKKIYGSLEDEK